MTNPNGPPPLPPYTGPGSPQDVPPAPGSSPIDPATLPKPIRDELQAPERNLQTSEVKREEVCAQCTAGKLIEKNSKANRERRG